MGDCSGLVKGRALGGLEEAMETLLVVRGKDCGWGIRVRVCWRYRGLRV
jgi:hypothetical protein